MSLTIEQVVGNWVTASGGGVAITPKAAGNTIYIMVGPAGPSGGPPTISDTAGNTITTLGSVSVANEYKTHAVIESCLSGATTIEVSGALNGGIAVIAMEVSGLADAAPLASDITSPTYSGNVASLPATGTINSVPALAVSWGCENQGDGIFNGGAYAGWTAPTITWQTSPPTANTVFVQYQEITTAQTVTAQVGVSATYDGVAMGVAVFGEASGAPAPTVTTVNAGSPISEGAAGVSIVGTNFTAGMTASITQGTVTVPQSVTYVSPTAASFTLSMEPAGQQLSFGAATLNVTVGGQTATSAITLAPPSGLSYATLTSINGSSSSDITADPSLAIGDQLEAAGNSAGTSAAPTGLTLNADATFGFASGNTPQSFYVRAWDSSTQTWGAWALQTAGNITITVPAKIVYALQQFFSLLG